MLLHLNTYFSNPLRSEHERHSPNCPFVKGEHTQNVPLSVTLATSPAQFPCTDGTDRIVCFGSGSCPHFLAAATKRGKICIWDVSKLMKVSHILRVLMLILPDGDVFLNHIMFLDLLRCT